MLATAGFKNIKAHDNKQAGPRYSRDGWSAWVKTPNPPCSMNGTRYTPAKCFVTDGACMTSTGKPGVHRFYTWHFQQRAANHTVEEMKKVILMCKRRQAITTSAAFVGWWYKARVGLWLWKTSGPSHQKLQPCSIRWKIIIPATPWVARGFCCRA